MIVSPYELFLEAFCEARDQALVYSEVRGFHGVRVGGDDYGVAVIGMPSRAAAAELAHAGLYLKHEAGELPGCDSCLGSLCVVPAGESRTFSCGDCLGGGPADYHHSDAAIALAAARSLK